MQTAYFPSREAAQASGMSCKSGFTLRRVNLEDAFLSLTGKKVDSGSDGQKEVQRPHGHANHGHGHGAHRQSAHGAHAKKEH
jgi:ABC-2 type transport system ATP-binding protein